MDNCLTNNESVFSKCYPIVSQMRTDYKGVVLPAGATLKPVRFKYTMRDYREHRKITFHQKHVNTSRNVDSAADCLRSDLHHLMEICFPAKTVRMSSRDPPWMTPLVKVLLKKKARLQARSVRGADLEDLKAKIDKNISENRMALATGNKGSRAWWRKVDVLTHRKDKDNLSLDKNFVQDLNTNFGNLCHDDNYISPHTYGNSS